MVGNRRAFSRKSGAPTITPHRATTGWLGKRGRTERDKQDRCRSTKLTVPPSSDARSLVYHGDRQARSTLQRDSVAPIYRRQLVPVVAAAYVTVAVEPETGRSLTEHAQRASQQTLPL